MKKIQDKKAEKLAAERAQTQAYEESLLAKGIVRGKGDETA
eukprot:SAG31_NODE_5892_length_2270_cov_2.825243_1_plen_41_part_00